MNFDLDAIRRAVERSYSELDPANRADLAFHLTDWLEDLQRLSAAFGSPDNLSTDDFRKVVDAFLVHVPNHLAAAGKLGVGLRVSDIFDVDAVEAAERKTRVPPAPFTSD